MLYTNDLEDATMNKHKILDRIDEVIVKDLRLTGQRRRWPMPLVIETNRGDYLTVIGHTLPNNQLCDVCKKKITLLGKVVIYNSITNEQCAEYDCIISGNSISCQKISHKSKRKGDIVRDLAGIVCSDECYNMFVLKTEVT